MEKSINTHCHLLNFKFIPDNLFKKGAPYREWLMRRRVLAWLARIVTILWPGKSFDKLHELLAIMRKDISCVAEELIREMDDANIVLSTPLMMDIEIASFNYKPESPYQYQIELISDIAIKYSGKIMPFIMFDPRRCLNKGGNQGRFILKHTHIEKALEEMGFLGVKMYPPLGYHPDPDSILNDDMVNEELKIIYNYCEINRIPITTHCSRGGAYSGELIRSKESLLLLTHPSGWEEVLKKYPKLYLNFAHFGGGGDFLEIDNPGSWSSMIKKLIIKYDNAYADVSYHSGALRRVKSHKYFKILNKLLDDGKLRKKIIFGTDWLMTRHTWKEKEYVEAFMKGLTSKRFSQIAFENPLNFLFPNRKLPQRIKDFFDNNKIAEKDYPQWMKDNISWEKD